MKHEVKHTNPALNPATSTTTYAANKIYEDGALAMVMTEDGYLKKQGNTFRPFYYLKDHLGSNRMVIDGTSGGVVQVTDHYPFGMSFADNPPSDDQYVQRYKYTGKELDREHGLNLYDYGARMYDPAFGRFTTPDPLAEKYYSISPYAYCNNNPVKFVDPDGREVLIWYRNKEGKQTSFSFNGKNTNDAPNNKFVKDIIAVYNYNIINGGGESLKRIVTDSEFKIGIVETDKGDTYSSSGQFIRFNPNTGLQLEDEYILSPATTLEHEAAHAVNDKISGIDNTPDAKYGTKEERKVIKGAELNTARANGELPKTHQGRKSHSEGKRIITKSVTSNQETSTLQSEELRKKIKDFNNSWTSE